MKKNALASGFALIEGDGIWAKVQRLDWFFVVGAGSALAGWGQPQSALGKNLSVRRSDYDAVGGYERIGFSLTEDQALVNAVAGNGGNLIFPVDPDMAIHTAALPNWREFLQQRLRWISGMRCLRWMGILCISVLSLRHFAVIAGLIVGNPAGLWVWAATSAVDLLILSRVAAGLKTRRSLWFFPVWEIFYTWTAPIIAAHFIFGRGVKWKGRVF